MTHPASHQASWRNIKYMPDGKLPKITISKISSTESHDLNMYSLYSRNSQAVCGWGYLCCERHAVVRSFNRRRWKSQTHLLLSPRELSIDNWRAMFMFGRPNGPYNSQSVFIVFACLAAILGSISLLFLQRLNILPIFLLPLLCFSVLIANAEA